jgi:hypothetical protein
MWRFTAMLNTFAGISEDSMRKRLIVLYGSLAVMAATGLGTGAAPKAATQASRTSASAADVKSQLPGTPAQTINGQKVQNHVSWERVTPPVSSRQ